MTKAETKGAERRAQIMSAARSQLIDHGHDRFSMREVAASTGMKLGNLQYYFPTKDDFLEALVRDELASNIQEIRRISQSAKTVEHALELAVRNLLGEWRSAGARIFIIMPLRALTDQRFRVLSRDIYATFFSAIAELLDSTDSDETPAQRREKARMITAVMDGALLQSDPDPGFEDDVIATVQLIASQ